MDESDYGPATVCLVNHLCFYPLTEVNSLRRRIDLSDNPHKDTTR